MKFTGKLSPEVEARVNQCDLRLNDPVRLAALKNTELMDSPREAAFDRLAYLAAQVLEVPLTIVSLVSDQKQFFKAAYGLPAPYDVTREIPIDGSICRYTLQGEPIISSSAADDPLLRYHPATGPWGIGAFIALPMITSEGQVLGAFCAVDVKERQWSPKDISVMSELTHSVIAEINLRAQIRDFKKERQLRETFVNALTHDLRNPLTAAKLTAQLILHKGNISESTVTYVDRILGNLDRADAMIRDLLDANRLKAGQGIPLALSDGDMDQILDTALQGLRCIHGPRFEVRNHIGSLPGRWDSGGVVRIIENLASNAIKYGSHDAAITISLARVEDGVELSVHNEGEPIAPDEQAKLFDSFHRTESASRSMQDGWGVGLTLVKGIAESHGGSVRVESRPEFGTTFSVRLPVDAGGVVGPRR